MYSQDDLLPVAALQHFLFCERQCALIHTEQLWAENRFTAQGRMMHERAHDEELIEFRDGVRIERGISLRSLKLGLIGKADVVEFHQSNGVWVPFPVEYKRGKPKVDDCDKVQLCAQAMCLEDMLGLDIPFGALFYGKVRRRLDVCFDDRLRLKTLETVSQLHILFHAGKTPSAVFMKKCETCSLIDLCIPNILDQKEKVSIYIKDFING